MVAENYQRKQALLNLWQPDRRTKKCPAKLPTKPWILSLNTKGKTELMALPNSVLNSVKPISVEHQNDQAKTEA